MKLTEFLEKDHIIPALSSRDKDSVLRELVRVIADPKNGLNEHRAFAVLSEREELGSTGIGEGVAIPHGKLQGLKRIMVCFGRSPEGIDFNSMDGNPAFLFFVLLAPEGSSEIHLKLLAKISKMLKKEPFRTGLLKADSRDAIYELIRKYDSTS